MPVLSLSYCIHLNKIIITEFSLIFLVNRIDTFFSKIKDLQQAASTASDLL